MPSEEKRPISFPVLNLVALDISVTLIGGALLSPTLATVISAGIRREWIP